MVIGRIPETSVARLIPVTVVNAFIPSAFKKPAVKVEAPVPPLATPKLPPIADALKSIANSVLSNTIPPLAFKSALNAVPVNSNPLPAV